ARKRHRIKGLKRGASLLAMPLLLELVRAIGEHGENFDEGTWQPLQGDAHGSVISLVEHGPFRCAHQHQRLGIIGIILLIGIVKKNGIMLIDFALEAERERGLSSEEAIHEACRLRFRPILMTTLCALLAGVALIMVTGTGSEIRQPLGYAMVGGLLVSQLLTLFTTPIVYIYMD